MHKAYQRYYPEKFPEKYKREKEFRECIERQLQRPDYITPLLKGQITTDQINISDLDISVRARYCLKNIGLKTLTDLLECPEAHFMPARTISRRTFNEVTDFIKYIQAKMGVTRTSVLKILREIIDSDADV